ncbi:type II toxin-antitoxin system RelE family toxin [Candidatus Nitrosotenuis cloacae]|uniref:type II toxin-antitoxin system RelE family toxin n=1 Tax=Candidatus Nitrosotenuis cloacae TaxID=1603555 RepID=UPI002281D39F|nr:type II toxin-antitoxin system RelE/ParE family toxin [Candidatus Nitrosotenuis cloacae]
MLTVKIHKSALKELNSLPASIKNKVLNACKSMANDPFEGDVKPLAGVSGVFRKRVGDYRIAFSVNFAENEVLIIKVGKRGKFYGNL